jgi:hypothetical protein
LGLSAAESRAVEWVGEMVEHLGVEQAGGSVEKSATQLVVEKEYWWVDAAAATMDSATAAMWVAH